MVNIMNAFVEELEVGVAFQGNIYSPCGNPASDPKVYQLTYFLWLINKKQVNVEAH